LREALYQRDDPAVRAVIWTPLRTDEGVCAPAEAQALIAEGKAAILRADPGLDWELLVARITVAAAERATRAGETARHLHRSVARRSRRSDLGRPRSAGAARSAVAAPARGPAAFRGAAPPRAPSRCRSRSKPAPCSTSRRRRRALRRSSSWRCSNASASKTPRA